MSALRDLPLAVARVDEALAVLDGSRRCCALFDVPPGRFAALAQALAADAALGDELALATARLTAPGAAEVCDWRRGDDTFEVHVVAAADAAEGAARTFVVWFHEVTEARRSERLQQEVRHYLEQVLADVPLGVAVLEAGLCVTFVNAPGLGLLRRLGGRGELLDVIGAGLEGLVDGDAGRCWRELCAAARDTARRADGERQVFGAGEGSVVVAAAAHPLHDRHGAAAGAILILEDVTEKARLEAQMVRLEKLATVGQMVVTVNHEINNPLAIIKSNAQAARLLNRDLDDKTLARLLRIEAQVDRIGQVTERLRTMDQVATQDYIADGPQMIDLGDRGGANQGAEA